MSRVDSPVLHRGGDARATQVHNVYPGGPGEVYVTFTRARTTHAGAHVYEERVEETTRPGRAVSRAGAGSGAAGEEGRGRSGAQ